jgi:hypothetical protein
MRCIDRAFYVAALFRDQELLRRRLDPRNLRGEHRRQPGSDYVKLSADVDFHPLEAA